MATYMRIKEYCRDELGVKGVKNSHIAHMKEVYGLNTRKAPNRLSPDKRKAECPAEKQEALKKAFEHFKMI